MGKIIKVALAHDFLTSFTGAERVLQALCQIYPNAPIYTLIADAKITDKYFAGHEIHTSSLQKSFLRKKAFLLINAMPRAVEEYNLSSYDLVISSSGAFSHGVITNPEAVHICYCHSPIRYLWDWHAEYLSERRITSSFGKYFAERFLSKIRIWDQVSAKRVDYWVANSKTVQNRIRKFYRTESEVIYPPVTQNYTAKKPQKGEYFVTTSRLTPNKRIDLLIKAVGERPLYIIGEGADYKRLKAISGDNIKFLGYLPEEEKFETIANAQAFLFAAEDDFGIAPIEALSCGIPVIAYSKGGTGETVIHRKNGYLFEEASVDSIKQAIDLWLKNGVEWSEAEIKKDTEKYSQEIFISKITSLIKRALNENN